MHMPHGAVAADESEGGVGPVVTLDDFAAEIGLPVERLKQWLEAGRGPAPLPPTRSGTIRFTRSAVDAWLLGR